MKEELDIYNRIKAQISQNKGNSACYQSKIVEIPIEGQSSKEHINIEIQTIIHNFEPAEVQTDSLSSKGSKGSFTLDIFTRVDKQVHAERFRIMTAYEPMAINIEKQVVGNK